MLSIVLTFGLATMACDDGGEMEPRDGGSAVCTEDDACESGEICDFGPTRTCVPDCQSAANSCAEPFECQIDDAGERYSCQDTTAPMCTGWPDGQTIPFATTSGTSSGATVHWPLTASCIVTSYDAGASDLAGLFAEAVAGWTGVSCSTLCFDPPVAMEEPPSLYRGERRLHLSRGLPVGAPIGSAGLTTTWFDTATGTIRGVEVQIADAASPATTLTDLLFLVGQGVGLDQAVGADAIMGASEPGRTSPVAPTALDEEALCALYGDSPYCAP